MKKFNVKFQVTGSKNIIPMTVECESIKDVVSKVSENFDVKAVKSIVECA